MLRNIILLLLLLGSVIIKYGFYFQNYFVSFPLNHRLRKAIKPKEGKKNMQLVKL